MTAATTALLDSIRADQQAFRTLLQALANPGQIEQIAGRDGVPDLNGNRFTGAMLLTLLDHEVSFAIEPASGAGELAAFIYKRTRSSVVSPDRAAFVVADHASLNPGLPLELRTGSFDYPDDGATLIVQVPTLDQAIANDLSVDLEGPGVDGERALKLSGLTSAFFEARATATAQYPIGIDCYFIDLAGRVIGLPRTTHVSITSGANA